MARPSTGALPVAQGDSRTCTSLLLEAIALRHQIAVLKRAARTATADHADSMLDRNLGERLAEGSRTDSRARSELP
jgi:hypothetical protein